MDRFAVANTGSMTRRHDIVTVLLMTLAAASVVLTLGVLRNVWVTFAVYHLGICLVIPAIWRRQRSRRSPPRRSSRYSFDRGAVAFGLGTGALAFAGILLLYRLFGGSLLERAHLRTAIDGWGGGNVYLLTAFMVLGNGTAEELFWRGFIHARTSAWKNRTGAILIITAFYASYHAFTALRLTGRPAVAVLLLAIVFGAGAFWGWTRERFGTPVPAVIGHALATAGYMLVYLVAIGAV